MTPHDLLAAFEILTDAPDGIARMRELVLQLAVRGKLVPQDPNDEPAGVLLERITAEKARLVKAGKISKPKWVRTRRRLRCRRGGCGVVLSIYLS
jgi:type I restriction enzyme S subunit